MPENSGFNPGNQPGDSSPITPHTAGAVGQPTPPAAPLQLTTFPVVAIILLHYCTCGIFPLVWLNLVHGRLPRVRPDDPSAGKAVGFCFIPFFNLYWIFFTYRRLCLRVDKQRELYGLPPSKLRGLATTACIFQVIPYINVLLGFTIIMPIYIGMMQSSINQLARQSETTVPRGTLPAQPAAPALPGWAVALIICGCILPLIAIVAILAAMLLPALAAAKHKAQQINSINNLKQIGLAFRIWEGDHNNQFPFNVSQAQGGTMELSQPGSNGYEQNPAPVFMVMSNVLGTTRILICPNDPAKHVATNFASLTADNISYELRTGTNLNDSHPQEILAVDPFNGLVLQCDGSVQVNRAYKTKAGN
jgi:hypothetical protein